MISIVVPSRGGAERLPLILDSLAAQTDPDLEVVVVIDGDVDGSQSVVEARTDLPVRAVVLPTNRGRAAALNAGFATARGEVLVRCDDDLVLPADYVAHQHALHADAHCGVVGMCANVYPERTAYATVYGEDADVAVRSAAHACPPEQRWRFWGGNVSVRRADFDRVGGYDESFRRYGWEDVDWGYRLHRTGVPIVVADQVEARHHVAATTTVVRALRAYESGWSQVQFEHKHGLVVEDKAAAPRTAWQHAVTRAAHGLDPDLIRRRGSRIDRALGRLPRALDRKRVALLVEAAARAGYVEASHSTLSKERSA